MIIKISKKIVIVFSLSLRFIFAHGLFLLIPQGFISRIGWFQIFREYLCSRIAVSQIFREVLFSRIWPKFARINTREN